MHSDLDLTTSISRFQPFALPDWTLTHVCSVELLAFIHLDPPHYNKPSIGNSTLIFNNEEIACFHHTMYGRWFGDKGATNGNYWPTLVCSALSLSRSDRPVARLNIIERHLHLACLLEENGGQTLLGPIASHRCHWMLLQM